MKRFYGQMKNDVHVIDEGDEHSVEELDEDDPFSNPYNHSGAVMKR